MAVNEEKGVSAGNLRFRANVPVLPQARPFSNGGVPVYQPFADAR